MDRPKWMPSVDDVREVGAKDVDTTDVNASCGCVDCSHYKTGLRAQIAVLEEMVEMFKVRSCPCGIQIGDKIAALRKELEG